MGMTHDMGMTDDIGSSFPAMTQEGGPSAFTRKIDFSKAEKLSGNGATCDVYVTRYMRKRVIVKRIKEKFRGKPTLLAAFAKEAEVGLNLDHKALPTYRFHEDDYIVMDYVDGRTLAELINGGDAWLDDPENIRRMFAQLVDVLGYLHDHNVVHCDVKPDNVMITTGTHNVVLIDLGEAFTYSSDDTSGDAAVYGLDTESDKGSPDIDFHGLGMIAGRLERAGFPVGSLGRFRRLCGRRGVTSRQLLDALEAPPRRRRALLSAAAGLLLAALAAALLILRPWNKDALPQTTHEDTATPEAPLDTVTTPIPATPAPAPSERPADKVSAPSPAPAPTPATLDDVVKEQLTPAVTALTPGLDRLESLMRDESLSATQLLEELTDFAETETATMSEAMRGVTARFPSADTKEVVTAFYGSEAYSGYISRSNRVQKAVSQEFRRRSEAERESR